MISINTNLSSLIIQNNFNKSVNGLNQAIERMSTGFKINNASDNAANFSIIKDLSVQISSLDIAYDNTLMGIDLVSSAEETLGMISQKLERLRALSVQAENGTYGFQSLDAINKEASAIVDEIQRIYASAEYNGINLAKGTFVAFMDSDDEYPTRYSSDVTTQYLNGYSFAFSGFTPFACVYPALANAISFCDEYNNGYLPFILHRSGIKRYYFSKIGGVGIIGGLTIFIPMFLAFLAIVMFSAPLTDLTNFSAEGFYFETMWEEYLLMGKGLLIMGMKLVLGFVFGFLWALVPLAISAWIPNRYVALIAPFVLYQSLWSLLTDSFFNPLYLLRCDFHGLGLSYPGALLIQFSYITIAALAFYFGLKRRIPDV